MTYTAEMWDKMQDIMARYNDHMTHGYLEFNTHLDKKALKEAFRIAIDQVPILKCTYKSGLLKAEWREMENYDYEKVFTFRTVTEPLEEVAEKFLLEIIDETKEAQIRVLHLRRGAEDALAILINHQVMDGGDLKGFYGHTAKIYGELIAGRSGKLPYKNGSRSDLQLYKGFSQKELEEIDKLISYSKKQKSPVSYPFEKSTRKEQSAKIVKHYTDVDTFNKLKTNGKRLGVSINDIILGAFYRTTLSMAEMKEGDTLGVPNMVNMRRYIENGESEGPCNLTSMVVPNLGRDTGKDILETVVRCKSNMDTLKENYPGLHGLALLRKVFRYAPQSLAKFLIGTFFKNPLIGISNIGIIDPKQYTFGTAEPKDVYMTGSVKYPPYMQLALTTYKSRITYTVAVYGTAKDHAMFGEMFKRFDAELQAFANADITEEKKALLWSALEKKKAG